MSTPQDQSQRMITFWNAGPKPSNLKAFMDTWYPSGITLPNALVSLALPATVEESILVSKQLFYMNGRLSRPKYITISPWPSLDNPSYILTGIGKHFRVKRQEVILLLRRPSRKDEILLGITQLKQKRFPILALNQFDTCLAAVDLSKSLRSVDLKGTYHAVDVLAPFLTKSETAHDYAVEGIDDSHLLQQFSAIDLVEAYRLYKEKLVYGGLPILNFYRMELPDFVYDSLLLVQERPKFCKYKKFDIK